MREPAHQTPLRGLKRTDALRALSLETVLQLCGATPDPHDPHKWHTDQGALSVNGAKFFFWSQGRGGGGAIDLVMALQYLSFPHALHWLETHVTTPAEASAPSADSVLRLPPPDPAKRMQIETYLHQSRALPLELLTILFQSGALYADTRSNAVFLLRDLQHEPVGAELRGTTGLAWRGMAPGSRKDHGYFAAPLPIKPQTVLLCESAIDALSASVLHPNWNCLSTAGARPNPRWLQPLLAEKLPVYCGYDADPTGDAMAREMIRQHPTVQRHRPPLPDWNDVLCARR